MRWGFVRYHPEERDQDYLRCPVRVLVIQTAFIGDAILSTCLLEALHAESRVQEVHYMVRKGNEGLFQNHPFLDGLIVMDKSQSKLKRLISAVKAVRSSRFDLVVNVQRFAMSGLITWLSGAKTTIGYQKNPLSIFFTHKVPHHIGDARHEVERCMDLLEPVLGRLSGEPRLYPDRASNAEPWKSRYVVMAPSSVWFTKQWPAEYWVELINRMPDELDVLLIGGPSDNEHLEGIRSQSNNPRVQNLSGTLSLLESAQLIQDAHMTYVNDSAPLHLASATNSSVAAIFCSTVPEFGFGPRSGDSHIFETNEKLDCRPCGLHGKKACPLGHFRCSKMEIDEMAELAMVQ